MNWKFLFLLLFTPLFCNAQGEANNWYFGNGAGVTFNTSPPSALTNGQLYTSEGCSSISDPNGNLLFYTDGRTVWNRNHQIMSNANYFTGNGLLGDPSSTSSGLIVPHPGNPNLFYIITVDEPHHDNAAAFPEQGPATLDGEYTDVEGHTVPQDDDGYNNGLNYSIVDMSLNNGLGNVISSEKNIHLVTYNPNDSEEIKYQCSEKITAVKGSDCNSIWILTHFIDSYYAFKIDQNGLNPNPVISTTGPVIPVSAYRRAAIGYMKVSPNGKKILTAHNTKTYNQVGNSDEGDGGVYLSEFNDATGEVNNTIALVGNVNAYGVEFSQETKKAYATFTRSGVLKINQWDLESNNIPASNVDITTDDASGTTATALQLAPNGKIYHSHIGGKLNVINYPELDGENVEYSGQIFNGAIDLNGRGSNFGLPPFIQSIFSSRINIINQQDENIITRAKLCKDESITLGYNVVPGATYTWRRNNNIINFNGNSIDVSPPSNATYPHIENYILELDLNDGSCPLLGSAEVVFYDFPKVQDYTLNKCILASNNNISTFNLTEAIPFFTDENENISVNFFKSQTDAEQNINIISNPSIYENETNPEIIIAKVINNEANCVSYAEITLTLTSSSLSPITITNCAEEGDQYAIFNLQEENLFSNFPNSEIIYYTSSEEAVENENPITNLSEYENEIPEQQTIYAKLYINGSCEGIIPVTLEVLPAVPIGNNRTITYCLENSPQPKTLSSGIPTEEINDYSYQWLPSGETSESIETSEITTHILTVTHKINGCTATREIEIIPSNKASFEVIHDNFKNKNTVEILVSEESEGDYEYSIDNQFSNYQDAPIFKNIDAGSHIIYVKDKNGCGISAKKIVILGIRQFFTPNNDGYNDYWNIIGKDFRNISNIKISVFDRFGKLLISFNGNENGWDGTYNGKNLPSDDYWYLIEQEGEKSIKGNFTLIR